MTSRELVKHLRKNGFTFDRQNGSHMIYENNNTGKWCSVPESHGHDIPKGTLHGILRDAGLK